MADLRANIPEFRTPIIDIRTGMIDPVWWQFFIKLFDRTGAEQGTDNGSIIIDIQIIKKLVDQIYAIAQGQAVQPPFKQKEYPETLSPVPARATAPIAMSFDVPTHGKQYDDQLHAVVTTALNGFMSAADKTKLNGITAGAAVASVSGTAPIVSSGGTTPAISITAATPAAAGSMSAADKTKLDGITAGAAVASVSGTAPIVSSGGTTPAISITPATTAAAGSMSAADKTRLDGISSSCFSAWANVAQAIPGGVSTKVIFGTERFDDLNEYNPVTGVFTAAAAGKYLFTAAVQGTQAVVTARILQLFVNGAFLLNIQGSAADTGAQVQSGTTPILSLAAGDTVDIRYFTTLADTLNNATQSNGFSGWRIK